MLIANMGCYFFGLHQALTVMFSSQGSKVAVFGQSWYQKSGGPVTQRELEFGVNQTGVSPNSCRSAQLTCSVPPRNLWLVPLHHRPSSLWTFHPSSASKCSVPPAAATFPQAAGNLLQTCAICDLPPPEKQSTSFLCPGSSSSSGSSSLKSNSCLKLFCRALSSSCLRCYFPPTTYQVLCGLTLRQDKL